MATSSTSTSTHLSTSSAEVDGAHTNVSMATASTGESLVQRKKKKPRDFDFSLWNFRHIALKIAYLGWNYRGLAWQESTDETIEARILDALIKTKLIQDRNSCNFSRCGRTDSGVSALGQVIAFNARSNLLEGIGVLAREDSRAHERKGDKLTEINYMKILNHVLPSDIRVLGYSPVHIDFSARFNCIQRMYKYFFPRGEMNIEVMQEASKKLIGQHDYRNFCKADLPNVSNFRRHVTNFTINPVNTAAESSSPYDIYEMIITGNAFLQHQVRYMAGVLFLIGNGLEEPGIIDHMLDIEKCPGKPNYGMASDFPLILFDCIFEDVDWQIDQKSYRCVVSHFQKMWSRKMIETTMIRRILDSIQLPLLLSKTDSQTPIPTDQIKPVVSGNHSRNLKNYKPLITQPVTEPIEERLERLYKKRKLAKVDTD